MNTMEVLTLLLVVFAALSYIDNHNKKKQHPRPSKVEDAILCSLTLLRANRITHPITFLSKLYMRVLDFSSALFDTMVLCQDLVQVKMRNFSHFNPLEAQPQCVFFHTIVRIHLVTYSYNGYEFVSYCRKLPDIRKSSGMPACNRKF